MEEKPYGVRVTKDGNTVIEWTYSTEEQAKAVYYRISKDPFYIAHEVQAWIVYPPAKPIKSRSFVEPLVTFGGW